MRRSASGRSSTDRSTAAWAALAAALVLAACTGSGGGTTVEVTALPVTTGSGDATTLTTAATTVPEQVTTSEPTTFTSAPGTTASGEPRPQTIAFEDWQVRYSRTSASPIPAAVPSGAPLAFRIVPDPDGGTTFARCVIEGDRLRFDSTSTGDDVTTTRFLPSRCFVEASQVGSAPGFADPDPVVRVVEVGFPVWEVRILAPAAPLRASRSVEITVEDATGEVFGVGLVANGACTVGENGTVSSEPFPAPAGTRRFTFTLETLGAGECFLEAQGEPLDYSGGGGRAEAVFTVSP